MPRKESLYPSDWRRIAEKDLSRAGFLLENHDPEAAGFYLQQAIELIPMAIRVSHLILNP
jgi:HEPN domain-containing protein